MANMSETIKNLNETERALMQAICDDCDDLDGWGFDRPVDVVTVLVTELVVKGRDKSENAAGAYLTDFIKKGLIEFYQLEDEVWVDPEVFAAFGY